MPPRTFGYEYGDLGDLPRIKRDTLPLWELTEEDAAGHARQERLGNGLVQWHTYHPQSGRQTQAELRAGQASRLNVGYGWDEIGRLKRRTRQWDGVGNAESFGYDGADRLTHTQVDGGASLVQTYDAIGNLTSKTHLGSYTYPGTGSPRPHAVQSVAGLSGAYQYDANGNLRNAPGGTTVTWTSFDQPFVIVRGGNARIGARLAQDRGSTPPAPTAIPPPLSFAAHRRNRDHWRFEYAPRQCCQRI